jgi:hypothetical protein
MTRCTMSVCHLNSRTIDAPAQQQHCCMIMHWAGRRRRQGAKLGHTRAH